DRRGDSHARAAHELDGTLRRDVLEHHAEPAMALGERREHLIDETALALEDIYRRIGHLAVHLEDRPGCAHPLEHRIDAAKVGYSRIRVRRGARRIELE